MRPCNPLEAQRCVSTPPQHVRSPTHPPPSRAWLPVRIACPAVHRIHRHASRFPLAESWAPDALCQESKAHRIRGRAAHAGQVQVAPPELPLESGRGSLALLHRLGVAHARLPVGRVALLSRSAGACARCKSGQVGALPVGCDERL